MFRQTLIFLGVLLVLPLLTWWLLPFLPYWGTLSAPYSGGTSFPASPLAFERMNVGPKPVGLPLITNVQIVDFDEDGRNDILACDAAGSRISLFTRNAVGSWDEEVLIRDLAAPAHVTVADIDSDGDRDLVVSILGNILPDDGVIGRVELYEWDGDGFVRHVILDDVRRVADAQPGDFDGDGDLDLAVAVFGYDRGSVLWLENRGDFQFRDHLLLRAPGAIHVPVADFDNDGDLDIATIISQDLEELWAFENLGQGQFLPRRLWKTPNFNLGSAGLIRADLDQDGDDDLILPVGDNLEDVNAYPQPYHGCFWFENRGDWEFVPRRIAKLGGTYAADVGDLDVDGDLDVVLVSMTNGWHGRHCASVVWLENDGSEQFTSWQIDEQPIHLVTVAVGDVNGDGRPDIVAGSLNIPKPYQRMGRVNAWINRSSGTDVVTK